HLMDDHDVLVLAAGRGLRLGQETPCDRAVALEQNLDGDQTTKLGVAGQVHGPHAALAKLADDLVVLEAPAYLKRRGGRGRDAGEALRRGAVVVVRHGSAAG